MADLTIKIQDGDPIQVFSDNKGEVFWITFLGNEKNFNLFFSKNSFRFLKDKIIKVSRNYRLVKKRSEEKLKVIKK